MERLFLLTPLREGRPTTAVTPRCSGLFLLTPLRAGRRNWCGWCAAAFRFLLTPLREGRHGPGAVIWLEPLHFYSRPCGRGDHW